MDNPGDWLYIVLMAVAVISSLISAARKKRQEAEQQDRPRPHQDTHEEEPRGKGFWEVLEDMQKQEESRQEDARRRQQERTIQSHAQPKKNARTPFLAGETLGNNKRDTQSLPLETDPAPILQEEPFRDPEELRKAVIYTEILNRKY